MSKPSHSFTCQSLRYTSGSCRAAARLVLMLLPLVAGACATPGEIPPIVTTPTDEHRPGMVVWHDLITSDAQGARAFYGPLLGWTFDEVGPAYTLVYQDGRRIGALVESDSPARQGKSDYWIPSVSVRDVDQTAMEAEEAGGRVVEGPTDVPRRGRVAVLADPTGAVFSVVRASGGDPPEGSGVESGWLWHEVVSSDPSRAALFYTRTLGYEVAYVGEAGDYRMLRSDARARAGIIQSPFEGAPSFWVPYLRVPDPAAAADRVRELGGRVILEPSQELRDGSLAVVQDPAGAPLALQRWPLRERSSPDTATSNTSGRL